MQEPSILEANFILLAQTKNRNLEFLLSTLAREENIRFESLESSENLKEQPEGQVVTFIIGSDVEDPIQSAQRLHALNKKAKIILFAKTGKVEPLKETVQLSPFLGTSVFCLEEPDEERVEKRVKEIIQNSLKAEKYRSVLAESNTQISLTASSQKPAFSQHFINKLMDIAPIGIAIVSPEGNVLGWNKEAASIFNKSEAQILGTLLPQYFGPTESNKLKNFLRQSGEKRKKDSLDSLTLKAKPHGSPVQVLNFTAAPFTYSGGTKKAFILAFKDISEQKRAEKELQKINQTLEERVEERTASLMSYQGQLRSLASKLSETEEQERHRLAAELHDNLGQMLAVNKMKLDLLLIDQLPDKIASDVEDIRQGIDDAIVYTRDLMSDLKPPPTLDKEDVRATIDWLAKKMDKHNLKVIIEDDGKPKKVTEEVRNTLLQCIRELLFNVIKHAKINEAVISMSRLNNRVQIIVEDKGKGTDLDIANSAPTEKGGFGLFNIKERMDLLGGSMEIDSVPGEGTKVTLLAPLKYEDNAGVGAQSSTDESISEKRIRVMLADDHEMVRKGLKKIVDAESDMMVVAEASNGKEAIELARKTTPDIIIMDIDMPHINGIDATKEIMSAVPNVHVIGLSSMDDDQEVIESMRKAGAMAYLSKSEAFETLSATIRSEAGR